jgi:AAA15 family ATPase/GTPase
MNIQIKNLGALKQAEFSLGDMTIICGGNNTGKTYATYALFGFLSLWRQMFSIHIPENVISQLFAEGAARLDADQYIKQTQTIVSKGCREYARQLPLIFAAPDDRFKTTEFQIILDTENIHVLPGFDRKMRSANAEVFSISKKEGTTEIIVTLLVEKEKVKIPKEILVQIISEAVKDIVFGHIFPNPFIASAERTGAAIFRKELNFARNRLLEEMSQKDNNLNPMELLLKVYRDYALPVKTNVDFTRQLETISKQTSFIAEKHPDALNDFADIIGGEYTVTRNDELYFVPNGKRVKLSMDESSSAVRSLLDIGFYLKHIANKGDLLMVDEPELNLHPENQRRVARLFARLTHLGIKIFITTHSDYIIKELNTLIMLNHDKPHLKRIAEKERYKPDELISADKIKVYIAEKAPVKLEDGSRKTRCQTLTPADISPEFGIEARSFDTTIETMNRIQEQIIWGGE